MPSVRPTKAPRASGFQKGAASPARPGTNTAPPVVATLPPSASRSDGRAISPTSCSQLTAAPAA